jgi:hypothetical protein
VNGNRQEQNAHTPCEDPHLIRREVRRRYWYTHVPPLPDGPMPSSSTAPPTVWIARGRHVGPAADDVLRSSLRRLKDRQVIDDFLQVPETEGTAEPAFEARWRVADTVTVRARLTLAPGSDDGQEWVLVAESEAAWSPRWPSPATMFWPEEADAAWDHDAVTGQRLRDINPLPADDKAVRRVLRDAGRDDWSIHVVVHEAMTTDERGRVPLAGMLPPSLRHRVVEHRAAPTQLRVANWALREYGVEVPRGGAVVLPGKPAPADYDADDFSVRSVFLDGTEPAELIHAVTRFAALPRPLPDGAGDAVTVLREDWRLLTLEEELDRERKLVAMYAEALEAMTKSRDLYREAAEQAHEALAAYRDAFGDLSDRQQQPAAAQAPTPLQQLTRTFERLKGSARALRPTPGTDGTRDGDTADADERSKTAERA